MTKLYACLGSGNCMKPWLAMNQLGQDFELELVDVLTGEQKSERYLKINPLGVVPYLVTQDGQGIGESNAMLWYLADGTHLIPPTAAGRAAALQWMFYEQSRLEPYISPARFFTTILPDERAAKADQIKVWQDAVAPGLDRLDAHLQQHEFMVGDTYSIADIAVFGYVHVMHEAGIDPDRYPAVVDWIARVAATPGFLPLSELGRTQSRAA